MAGIPRWRAMPSIRVTSANASSQPTVVHRRVHQCHMTRGRRGRKELPDDLRVFLAMRIPEENCNMVLLAAVALISVAIAGGAELIGSPDARPARLADRTIGYTQPAPSSSDPRLINVSDGPPVRVVGAPFVPNTNPRER